MRCREDLSSAIDSSDCEIVVLTETWLSSKIQNNEIFNCHKRFNAYRYDRSGRLGGGVLIAVVNNIASSIIDACSPIETAWVDPCVNHKRLILGVCYRPPSANNLFL